MSTPKEQLGWDYSSAPETTKVIIEPKNKLFIDGKFVSPKSRTWFASINPATEEKLADIASAGKADVDAAVRAAKKALPKWSKLDGSVRAKYLYRIARRIQERSRELAILETMDGGKPIKESRDVDLPLAAQHFFYFKSLLEPAGYSVVTLTGSGRASERQKQKRLIGDGKSQVIVGTHALISEDVKFRKLGFVVVDEQHRFGVMQRFELLAKGEHPDVLVMTATPIPRTLALTVYGDLDVSIIDELPPGRRPIVTKHVTTDLTDKVHDFVREQIEKGRQAYVVCPLIDESETKAVKAASKLYESLAKTVFPDLRVALLHGRLKRSEKESVMADFKKGLVQILVATTVIEVGVDVSNATVMLIEHAETFGLAQLHQLRGRVGRGVEQGYCILRTGAMNDNATERVRTMVKTQDGFHIAETDLRLRGPGEFFGTKQSGLPSFRVANLIRDRGLLENAHSEAGTYIENPNNVQEMQAVLRHIQGKWQRRYGLVKVG